MNKKLFIVRATKRKLILIAIIVAAMIICCCFFTQLYLNSKNNFLKYHSKVYYTPAIKPHSGFFGKANDMLDAALKERTNQIYQLDKLDSLYSRLHFYYPANEDDYLASPEDIRLIGFTPKPEERAFYFNSYFATLLDLQRKNLSARFFNIKFDRQHKKIESIAVDSSRFKLALQNSNWPGTINFNDPFLAVQPGLPYLIAEHKIFPLFNTNISASAFIRTDCQWQVVNPLDKGVHYVLADYEKFYLDMNKADSSLSQPYLLKYSADGSLFESSVRFFNSGKRMIIQAKGADIDITGGLHTLSLRGNESKDLPLDADVINLSIRPQGLKKVYKAVIVKKSPFSIASRPEDVNAPADRIHMNLDYYDLFARQEVSQLEAGIQLKDKLEHVTLSNNILLSKYLEDQLKYKATELLNDHNLSLRSDDEYELSLCLMDIATGEIIAAPFYGSTFGKNNSDELTDLRNFNLLRHNIGSAFKPLLSFAAAVKYPELANFSLLPGTTAFVSDTECKVLDYPVPAYGMSTHNDVKYPKQPSFWPFSPISRTTFLATSHDNYPVALTMLALTESDDHKAIQQIRAKPYNNAALNKLYRLNGPSSSRIVMRNNFAVMKDISTSSFIQLLSNLYGIRGQFEDNKSLTYDPSIINELGISRHTFFSLYPDLSNLGTESFDNINSDKIDFRDLERFTLGEQNNIWTNVKLAEAYSRLLSKRRIKATWVSSGNSKAGYLFENPQQLFNINGKLQYEIKTDTATIEKTWNSFLNDWRDAVKMDVPEKLLKPAYQNFCAGVPDHNHFDFYCKTGTPQADNGLDNEKIYKKGKDKIWINEGIFAFGITNKDRHRPKGVVGVIYVKHLTLKLNQVNKGIGSKHARDFFTSEVFQKIVFYNQKRF